MRVRVGYTTLLETGLCLVALACGRTPREISATTSPVATGSIAAAPTTAATVRPPLDPEPRGWDLRVPYSYQVDTTTDLDLGPGRRPLKLDFSGDVSFFPVETARAGTTLVATLTDIASSRRSGPPSDLDKVADELRGARWAVVLAAGLVSELRLPRGMTPVAANVLREISAALQFARPTEPANEYSTEEFDAAGRYTADYRADADGGNRSWHKKKTRYVALLGKAAPPTVPLDVFPDIAASDWSIRLSPEGRPESVTMREEVHVKGAQAPVSGVTTLSLEGRPAQDSSSDVATWESILSSTVRVAADEPYGPPPAPDALDDARIGGMTFEKVVAEFEREARDSATQHGTPDGGIDSPFGGQAMSEGGLARTSRLFEALSAMFRRHPETIDLAVKRIQSKSPATPMLVSALGSASSDAAQAALLKLAGSTSLDAETRARATTALVRTPRPDKASADALIARLAAHPFDETALYGIGTYSRRTRDAGQTTESRALGEVLLSKLSTASTPDTLILVLGGIANSGYSPALARIRAYLSDDREDVRAAATGALRSMDDPKADDVLADKIANDPSSKVRIRAIEAARVRQPTDGTVQALVQAASSATDPHVRYRAVELMAAWLSRRPEIRSTLERVAQADAEARVRDRAKVAL
jgi:hypothetical protein